MSLTVGSTVARMIPEEPGEDPGEWPELQSAPVNKDKVRWGQGVQSEEEVYLGKLGVSGSDRRLLWLISSRKQAGDNQKQGSRYIPPAEKSSKRRHLRYILFIGIISVCI